MPSRSSDPLSLAAFLKPGPLTAISIQTSGDADGDCIDHSDGCDGVGTVTTLIRNIQNFLELYR